MAPAKSSRVELVLEPELKELWEKEAALRGLSLSELIRRSVQSFLRHTSAAEEKKNE